jgi:uncharacterized coiled-coil DUF342 family protein
MTNNTINFYIEIVDDLRSKLSDAQNKIIALTDELTQCKEYLGYSEDTSIEEMNIHKKESEDYREKLRKEDPEYNQLCEKSDQYSDLIIRLGALQYSVSDIFSEIKALTNKDLKRQKKSFVTAFFDLKELINDENIEQFFMLLHKWIAIQEDIHEIDVAMKK